MRFKCAYFLCVVCILLGGKSKSRLYYSWFVIFFICSAARAQKPNKQLIKMTETKKKIDKREYIIFKRY
jgi:hypothetical protein